MGDQLQGSRDNDDDKTSQRDTSSEAPDRKMELAQQHRSMLSDFSRSTRHDPLNSNQLAFLRQSLSLENDTNSISQPRQNKKPRKESSSSSLDDLLKLGCSVARRKTGGRHTGDRNSSRHDVRLAASLPVAASFQPTELFDPASPVATSRQLTEKTLTQHFQNPALQAMLSTPYDVAGTSSSNAIQQSQQSPHEALFLAASSQSVLRGQESLRNMLSGQEHTQLGGLQPDATDQSGIERTQHNPFDSSDAIAQSGNQFQGPHANPFDSSLHLDARRAAGNPGQTSLVDTTLVNYSGGIGYQPDSTCSTSVGGTGGGMQGNSMQGNSLADLFAASHTMFQSGPTTFGSTDHALAMRNTIGGPSEIFPVTLYRLLTDLEKIQGGGDIARFIYPHGKAFIVSNPDRFETEVMPKYFPRMNRFASFQRQLNLYDFARVLGRDSPDRGAYYHDSFVRDRPELAATIRRRKIKGLFTVPLEKRRYKRKHKGSPSPESKQSYQKPDDDSDNAYSS